MQIAILDDYFNRAESFADWNSSDALKITFFGSHIPNTDELIERGGFGQPTFFYKEKMFFGNDRLHLLEEAISKNLI